MGVGGDLEKVKVTENQAVGLKYIQIPDLAVVEHVDDCDMGNDLNKLSLDELIRALYIGYEVEPEFKVGDWVAVEEHKKVYVIGKIVEIETENTLKFAKVNDLRYEVPQSIRLNNLRHATPEEIQQEKERRKWADIGRQVNEFKVDDIVRDKENQMLVIISQPIGIDSDWAREYELVCPVEIRFDK